MEFPVYRGKLEYRCLGCSAHMDIGRLLYTCPECGSVLIIEDLSLDSLSEKPPTYWRSLLDARAGTKTQAMRGIFRFYEFLAPLPEKEDIVYLGEAQTPIIPASPDFRDLVGLDFAYKNDGQNPSASFKDRGMACAFSYLRYLIRKNDWDHVLTVCASTGDTSASAALYAAYVGGPIKSVVILPQGKVTPPQLAQPLGSGALVLEIPGVFDDCMKVVEYLADNYRVALLNSKNAWRICGQESYAFEIAQWYDWDVYRKAIFVPIGNAGNITAIMSGFLKLHRLGIIRNLPRIFGVQSEHADPVFRYYSQADPASRVYEPVKVQPSVAQAAMIGNPVSFPRVRHFAEAYEKIAGPGGFQVIRVTEQEIIDGMLQANRHGHISCTQGGECLAGLWAAKELGLIESSEMAILDSTAHSLKFIAFQDMYFNNAYPPEYGVTPKPELINQPELIIQPTRREELSAEKYHEEAALAVAERLGLTKN